MWENTLVAVGIPPLATSAAPRICQMRSTPTMPIRPPAHLGSLRFVLIVLFGARSCGSPVAAGAVTDAMSALGRRAHREEVLAELVAQLVEVRVTQHLRRARAGQIDRHL